MNEQQAFLADICEHPDDDAPRLVYADWLEEHDEADRAAFIRQQCAAPGATIHGGNLALQPWARSLTRWCEEVQFRRGFVEAIDVNAQSLLHHAEAIFHAAPLRQVRLLHLAADDIGPLSRLPQLERLRCLIAHGAYRRAGATKLFGSPHLSNLLGLGVSDTPIGTEGLAALVGSPSLSRLTHLHLGATGIRHEGVALLARSSSVSNLVALDLRGNGLTARAVRELDHSPHLGNLRRLGLWYNRLGDEGLAEFTRLPLFARLKHLSIGNNGFTARGLRALAEAPALASLRTLWLGVDRYGGRGIEALARSPYLHAEARVGIWLNNNLPDAVKSETRRLLGDRVSFDNPGDAWGADATVGWPLWQP